MGSIDSSSAADEVPVVIFERAGQQLGADVADLLRVARRGEDEGRRGAERALVVKTASGDECEIPIERVIGFERLGRETLRRLPGFLAGLAGRSLIGFAVGEQRVLPLVDLGVLAAELSGDRPRAGGV